MLLISNVISVETDLSISTFLDAKDKMLLFKEVKRFKNKSLNVIKINRKLAKL
jgi:hypothetical protein